MAEAQARGFAHACHDRAALALIDGQLDQEHPRLSGQGFESGGASRAAGIVDQHARQVGLEQFGDDLGHGEFVVVDRDDGAGIMHVGLHP
ncbi:hypothetical protein D3C86_1489600 [compost metagenome]